LLYHLSHVPTTIYFKRKSFKSSQQTMRLHFYTDLNCDPISNLDCL
jgi:hypothetical protein